ncbi:protein disulfide oxidoreductase [Methylomarinum vadi]|uniref:protein disulfide oxidoreductase n=1 Tax=Methylomarinum vadi TaxID=438855 RepID=UPI0009FD6588|nr:protein disulfide oxidoreductase [Methylomarinum vadi]
MVKKILFYLAVAVLIFGGQFFLNRGLATGQPPAILQKTLGGREAMAAIEKGPAVIYFWAEWCGICNMMKGSMDEVLRDYPGITVAVRSGDDGAVTSYLRQHGLQWPVVNDTDGEIAGHYGVKGVPALFFIGGDGDIWLTSVGFSSELGIRFRLWLSGW